MFLPIEWTPENFRIMLIDQPFLQWMKNSLIVAGTTTIACLLICTSAAFAFSRFRFRGRESGLILFLAIQAFPAVLALIPQAQILGALGLYGSHLGLILAYTSFTLVFCTWNLKGYFDTIPIDLEEAGRIDGCGPVQSFLLIALPLARPALAVTALFGFFGGWGEYPLASVLIPAPDAAEDGARRHVRPGHHPVDAVGPLCRRRAHAAGSADDRLHLPAAVPGVRPHPGRRQGVAAVTAAT